MEYPINFTHEPQNLAITIDVTPIDMLNVYCQAMTPFDENEPE